MQSAVPTEGWTRGPRRLHCRCPWRAQHRRTEPWSQALHGGCWLHPSEQDSPNTPPSAGAVLPCRGWGSGRQGPPRPLSGSAPAPRSPSLLSDLWVGKQAQPLGSCHPWKAAPLLPGCLGTLMFPASCLVCARWPLPPLCRGSLRRIHEAPDGHPLQTSQNAGLMPASRLGHPPGCPRPPGASSLGSRGCGRPPVSLKGGLPPLLPLKTMPSGGSSTLSCRTCCGVPCRDLEKVRKS